MASGSGWYGAGERPAVYRSVSPAWSDVNLHELAGHIESPLFFTHIRAAIGSPVQQTNCHPFRHGNWLFVHNGYIGGFPAMRRDLMLAIHPDLFAEVHGSTDTEVVFHLALTMGLEEDPLAALERTVGFIEATAERHGVPDAVQGTFGVSDGVAPLGRALLHASTSRARCSCRPTPPPIQHLHPENERFRRLTPDDRAHRLRAVLRPAGRVGCRSTSRRRSSCGAAAASSSTGPSGHAGRRRRRRTGRRGLRRLRGPGRGLRFDPRILAFWTANSSSVSTPCV